MGDAAVGREVMQAAGVVAEPDVVAAAGDREHVVAAHLRMVGLAVVAEAAAGAVEHRSEEHTSELQSLMRSTYDVFCLKQKKRTPTHDQPFTSHKYMLTNT